MALAGLSISGNAEISVFVLREIWNPEVMCRKSPCSVARCYGCPGTDWNSFTWRVTWPAAVASLTWSTVERRFEAYTAAMKYPGTCGCLWTTYGGEVARDLSAGYNSPDAWYPVASSSVLLRRFNGSGYTWRFELSRYSWDWGYWHSLYGADPFGSGWHWSNDGPQQPNCEFYGGRLPYGYPGYGVGWGYGWGYGFDPYYWYIGAGHTAVYNLVGTFDCAGTNRLVRDDSAFADEETYVPDAYPAYIDVDRIPLDRIAA